VPYFRASSLQLALSIPVNMPTQILQFFRHGNGNGTPGDV